MTARFSARKRTARKGKARCHDVKHESRRLIFQALEDRWLLATFADAGATLNLSLLTNEQLAIVSTGPTYSLSLGATGTWSGTNDANVTGNGASTLTVNSAGITAFTAAINITDAGSAGGDAVSFSNSLSNDYANNFVITLTNSTSGLAFTGDSSFTGNSALTVTASGAIVVNFGAVVSTSGGPIDLVATGTNAPLTVSGNVLSNGGAITLQATGAVTVGTGVTVNSGSGTLTLAADVTVAGAGDDGVGTLSIDAGATVTSSNSSSSAITLRGADVNIDTSSNPAVVGGTRQLGTTASATISPGLSDPDALAFDSSGNLYVANSGNNTVSKFAPGSTTASATYSAGLSDPDALALDSNGNLYVANAGNNTVSKFAPGSTTASATLTGLNDPRALAFDSSGNLYVANTGNNTVSKFASGSATASATYSTGLSGPKALAFDASGNLYVANGTNNTVSKFAPGSTTAIATYSAGLSNPDTLAFDSSGNLYVANYSNSTVSKFAPGSTAASATYSAGVSNPDALAIDSTGNLYVANGMSVSEYAPGSTMVSATYSAVLAFPRALAFDSGGNLYVANGEGKNTVTKFAPGSTMASATYPSVLSNPYALAIDSTGNLYVANAGNNTVSEFAPGGTTASATYSAGLNFPDALIFDSSGNLYVANANGSSVKKFAPGSTTASATYVGSSNVTALAFDSSGNLYVANLFANAVTEFAPGSTTASATYSAGVSAAHALAFDSSGNLYVANYNNSTVVEFAPGSTTAVATYSAGLSSPKALAIDANGNLYVANYGNKTVSEFAPGSNTAIATLIGLTNPWALAFDGSDNLYVTNFDGTVNKFAPGSTTASATYSASAGASPDALAFDSSGNLYVANFYGGTVSEFSPTSTDATACGVTIQSSVESRPMLIGGTNSSPVAGINLTSAELAEIVTLAAGTITIGDPAQTGNITFSTATPATTAGAALNVVQSTVGAGAIILDDTTSSGTGLNGNGGMVTLTAGTGGVQTTLYATGLPLATNGFAVGNETLNLTLDFAPTVGTQLTVVSNTALPATGNRISGTFSNLPQGGTYTTSYLGTSYMFQANYQGGDGNDLVLSYVAPKMLLIIGTSNSNDDVSITFTSSTQFNVSSGGTTTPYSTSNINQVVYNAPADGTFSKLVFDDPSDVITADQSLDSTTISDGGFQFQANGVANLYLYGGSGSSASVNVSNGGSSSSNFFVVDTEDDYSYIADPGTGAYSELSGFGTEAITGSAGTTYAYIYSKSHAATVASPTQTTFTVGGVTSKLSNFPQVYVVGAADGTDSVTLDSSGGTFVSSPGFSYVGGTSSGTSFLLGALYAANVTAQAAGTSDKAVFYSYPNNTFTGTPGTSSLAGSTTNIAGSTVTFVSKASGYSSVSVFESGAGTDSADLTSPGNGSFFGTSTASTLSVGTSTITVNTYFVSSGQTVAVPGQVVLTGAGTDAATIYDAPGNNALTASGSAATLTTSLGSLTINKFGSVTADKQNGTNDTVHKGAIDFALTTIGNWTSD